MTNFVYDGVALPDNKVDSAGGSTPLASNPTRKWSPNDSNRVFQALKDARTAILDNAVNVRAYASAKPSSALADGTDDAPAIRAAISANPGRTIYFPRGSYLVNSTIFITATSIHLQGDFGNRFAQSGTQLIFMGTGPCIQIGVNDNNAWDAGEYNGQQDHLFENLWISHGAPDTALTAANAGSTPVYKAGAYGIWDWRGGGIRMRNCGVEKFEANFVGVESDINDFQFVLNLYSKYGWYLGPRCDQNTIRTMYSFFCDRAITIDRAGQTRIECGQFVACGTSTTSSIEIRQGSHGTRIHNSWFERSGGGYQGTDAESFVSVGRIAGYGAGGSIQSPGGSPTTSAVQSCIIDRPLCYSLLPGVASHTKYLVSVGKCTGLLITAPSEYINSSLNNFDALVGVPNDGINPSNSDTQIEIRGIDSGTPFSKMYANASSGSPALSVQTTGTLGAVWYVNNNSPFSFRFPDRSTGADRIDLDSQGNLGNVFLNMPTYAGGQTTRLHLSRAQNTTDTASGAPAAGTWERGDMVRITDPTQTGPSEFICFVGGTPGSWAPAAQIMGRELVVSISASQDNYNPTSFSTCELLLVTATAGSLNITGFAAPTIYNGNVAKGFTICNAGSNAFTLKHLTTSTGTQQIIGLANADTSVAAGTARRLLYSPSKTLWLVAW